LDNEISGQGECVWKSNVFGEGARTYKGQWQKGLMHGEGEFIWEDGRRYIGSYSNDMKEGFGRFEWPDGRLY
jgi:hypothetical protein